MPLFSQVSIAQELRPRRAPPPTPPLQWYIRPPWLRGGGGRCPSRRSLGHRQDTLSFCSDPLLQKPFNPHLLASKPPSKNKKRTASEGGTESQHSLFLFVCRAPWLWFFKDHGDFKWKKWSFFFLSLLVVSCQAPCIRWIRSRAEWFAWKLQEAHGGRHSNKIRTDNHTGSSVQ